MIRILIPSAGPDSWKQFLAKPDLHWAVGYSARTMAHCWEASDGIPGEVRRLLDGALGPVEPLVAFGRNSPIVAMPSPFQSPTMGCATGDGP